MEYLHVSNIVELRFLGKDASRFCNFHFTKCSDSGHTLFNYLLNACNNWHLQNDMISEFWVDRKIHLDRISHTVKLLMRLTGLNLLLMMM